MHPASSRPPRQSAQCTRDKPIARILEAAREPKGEASAQFIDGLKKPDTAREAVGLYVVAPAFKSGPAVEGRGTEATTPDCLRQFDPPLQRRLYNWLVGPR